jgi:predicted membrane protein
MHLALYCICIFYQKHVVGLSLRSLKYETVYEKVIVAGITTKERGLNWNCIFAPLKTEVALSFIYLTEFEEH